MRQKRRATRHQHDDEHSNCAARVVVHRTWGELLPIQALSRGAALRVEVDVWEPRPKIPHKPNLQLGETMFDYADGHCCLHNLW